jgi:hypothetical protein
MTETSSPLLQGWRYGMHPHAVGMQVRSLGRVELPLGEALRLEFAGDATGASDMGHLQYYISTDAGPWAMWLTCPRADLPEREAALHRLVHPLTDGA